MGQREQWLSVSSDFYGGALRTWQPRPAATRVASSAGGLPGRNLSSLGPILRKERYPTILSSSRPLLNRLSTCDRGVRQHHRS